MKIQLPFAYASAHRVKYGRLIHRSIYRANVVVEPREVERHAFRPALRLFDTELVYGLESRLFRPMSFHGRPMTVEGLARVIIDLDRHSGFKALQSWALADDYLWSKADYPRPTYVRTRSYNDMSAVFFPPEPLPPGIRHPWSEDDKKEAGRQALAAYERNILLVGGEIWVAVPEPVWVLRQQTEFGWNLEIETQPTIWEAVTTFSIENLQKAREFAEILALDIVDSDEPAEILDGFERQRADLTALASATIGLSDEMLLPPEPDEQVPGTASMELVRKALLCAGGHENFDWTMEGSRFGKGVSQSYMRRRWEYELGRPEHLAFREALWSQDQEVRRLALAQIDTRRLADVDPDVEDALATLDL